MGTFGFAHHLALIACCICKQSGQKEKCPSKAHLLYDLNHREA